MKKLIVARHYEFDYDYGVKDFAGYVIVERKGDASYIAHTWNKRLAEIVRKALEKVL